MPTFLSSASLFFDVSLLSLYLVSQIDVPYQEMFLRIRSFQFLVARRLSIVWHIPPFEVLCVPRSAELEIIPSASSPSDPHHSLGFSFMSHSHLPAEDPSPIHKSAWALLIGKCSECHLLCPWPWKDKAGGGGRWNAQCRRLSQVEKELPLFRVCSRLLLHESHLRVFAFVLLWVWIAAFGNLQSRTSNSEHQGLQIKTYSLLLIFLQNFVRHHWVHRRRQDGKCKQCGKVRARPATHGHCSRFLRPWKLPR